MKNTEVIEMLSTLKKQALRSHNDTAVLDVNIDSFVFVIDAAIKKIEEQNKVRAEIEQNGQSDISAKYVLDLIDKHLKEVQDDD